MPSQSVALKLIPGLFHGLYRNYHIPLAWVLGPQVDEICMLKMSYMLKYRVRRSICRLERKPVLKPPKLSAVFYSVGYFWRLSFQMMNKLIFQSTFSKFVVQEIMQHIMVSVLISHPQNIHRQEKRSMWYYSLNQCKMQI